LPTTCQAGSGNDVGQGTAKALLVALPSSKGSLDTSLRRPDDLLLRVQGAQLLNLSATRMGQALYDARRPDVIRRSYICTRVIGMSATT
jgi:hypothetical protein